MGFFNKRQCKELWLAGSKILQTFVKLIFKNSILGHRHGVPWIYQLCAPVTVYTITNTVSFDVCCTIIIHAVLNSKKKIFLFVLFETSPRKHATKSANAPNLVMGPLKKSCPYTVCGSVLITYLKTLVYTFIGKINVNAALRKLYWSQIHERTISLKFLGIILRLLRLDVSVYNAYITL
jgi:hypothetical protein